MFHRQTFFFLVLLLSCFGPVKKVLAQPTLTESRTLVALRMIGHRILLRSGDTSSLVLPIEKEGNRYKISFQLPFQFSPDVLVALVDSVVKPSGIAGQYIVEIEACTTRQIVYSFQMGASDTSGMIPCTGRVQPSDCYNLFFTIVEPVNPPYPQPNAKLESSISGKSGPFNYTFLLFFIVPLMILSLFVLRKKSNPVLPSLLQEATDPDVIPIGSYTFNKRNMNLSVNNQTIELTGKEADLLFLLHASANKTIERNVILNAVWGDDGDYAGRTLDVFISKLRKKLETDESLKIVNIRGVGYKLIVN